MLTQCPNRLSAIDDGMLDMRRSGRLDFDEHLLVRLIRADPIVEDRSSCCRVLRQRLELSNLVL